LREPQKNASITREKIVLPKDGGRFSVLAAKDRNRHIQKLHDKGLSIRQISRLTGISKKIVERNI